MNDIPEVVYATFAGQLDQNSTGAVGRLFNGLTTATQKGVKAVHLLFQTTGGTVTDGICLYNFFRTLPIGLSIYNAGGVSSIGVIAYLGASRRYTSAHATFMVHRSYFSPVAANSDRLKALAEALVLDDQRTEAILKANIKLSPEKWAIHEHQDLYLSADDAVVSGLAHDIAEFAPPKDSQLYNL